MSWDIGIDMYTLLCIKYITMRTYYIAQGLFQIRCFLNLKSYLNLVKKKLVGSVTEFTCLKTMYFDRSAMYLCFMNSYLLSWFMFVHIYYFKLEIWFYRSITIETKKILQYKWRILTDLQLCKILKSFMLMFDRK